VLAAAVYKGRQVDAFNALLTAGSPSVLAEQRSLLDHLARDQQQLQGVSDLKARYDGQKKPIDQLTPEALGVDPAPRLTVLKVVEPPKRQAGVKVKTVAELVDKLKNEAKVI